MQTTIVSKETIISLSIPPASLQCDRLVRMTVPKMGRLTARADPPDKTVYYSDSDRRAKHDAEHPIGIACNNTHHSAPDYIYIYNAYVGIGATR